MEIISVKEKLAAGEPSIGTWSSSGDPTVVEVLARTELDWINLDFEHNPIDVSTAIHCLRALGGTGKAPFARIPWNDPVWIKRVLDIGFLGVVVPDVKSPDDAREGRGRGALPPRRRAGNRLVAWNACIRRRLLRTGQRNGDGGVH